MLTLAQEILKHIFGIKYYAVVLKNPLVFDSIGRNPIMMSGYVFRKKSEAKEYFYDMKYNSKSAKPIKIISFRSRQDLFLMDNNWKIRVKQ